MAEVIRVLRVLEYRYANIGVATADMERWQVPASGTFRPSGGTARDRIAIHSAVLPMDLVDSMQGSSAPGDMTEVYAVLNGRVIAVPPNQIVLTETADGRVVAFAGDGAPDWRLHSDGGEPIWRLGPFLVPAELVRL